MPILKTIQTNHKKREPNKQWSKNGDPFYHTSAWRKLRVYKIKQSPICEVCLKNDIVKEASVIDHHLPRRLWKELSLTLSNLTSMCTSHHNKKSYLERHVQTKQQWIDHVGTNELYSKE